MHALIQHGSWPESKPVLEFLELKKTNYLATFPTSELPQGARLRSNNQGLPMTYKGVAEEAGSLDYRVVGPNRGSRRDASEVLWTVGNGSEYREISVPLRVEPCRVFTASFTTEEVPFEATLTEYDGGKVWRLVVQWYPDENKGKGAWGCRIPYLHEGLVHWNIRTSEFPGGVKVSRMITQIQDD